MKKSGLYSACLFAAAANCFANGPAFKLAKVTPIPGPGGWDYVTVDAEKDLVYLTRSTHTQAIDAKSGKIVADITGQKGNHGVALAPSSGRGFISDGKDEAVVIFDLTTYAVLGRIKAAEDADGIIYDKHSNKVLLVCGDAGVLIPIPANVDPSTGSAEPAIDLGGKPEFLASDGEGRIFVNLEDKDQVAEVDIDAGRVLARWPVAPGGSPVGMSIDRKSHELFIGCRKPQKLIIMSSVDGKILGDLPIGAGVDATGFDNGFIFASCRDGSLTIARETSPGSFEVVQTLATKMGARTLGINAKTHEIFLPTAEFSGVNQKGRPMVKPGTFMLLTVKE